MVEHEKDRRLEAQLDFLLSAYSAVEPRPGLELRIRAGLRARAARRRKQWMLIFPAAAVVALVAFIGGHARESRVPNYVSASQPRPDTSLARTKAGPSSPAVAARLGGIRRVKVDQSNKNLVLLQLADASQGSGLVFQEEKLYLSPAVPEEPNPETGSQISTPDITIESLGVQPVEIKELAPARESDSNAVPQGPRIVFPLP